MSEAVEEALVRALRSPAVVHALERALESHAVAAEVNSEEVGELVKRALASEAGGVIYDPVARAAPHAGGTPVSAAAARHRERTG